MTTRVGGLYSVPYLNQTPIFGWWVVRCTCKNGYQKDNFYFKEIGVCDQDLLVTLGFKMPIIGGVYLTFLWLIVGRF